MSQIALYIDKEIKQLVLAGAKASGVSKSRWVADAIRRHAHEGWPEEFQRLAGVFPDFPLREETFPTDCFPRFKHQGTQNARQYASKRNPDPKS